MAGLIQYRNNVAGVVIILDADVCRIGRGDSNDVVIDDDLVSREHAVVERVEGPSDGSSKYILRDLGSTNGTFVNHKQVKEHLLNEDDMIRIGQSFFKFSLKERSKPGETKVIRKTLIPGVYITTDKKG